MPVTLKQMNGNGNTILIQKKKVICFSSEVCLLYWNGIHISVKNFIFI